jgi:hypothetical protein
MVGKIPKTHAVIVLRQEGQPSMRREWLFCFFYLESEYRLSYHDFTLLVKRFAWRQSFYTRSLSGQQGFLLLKYYFYRGI